MTKKFLWGGATASSQYEGDFTNRGIDTQDCRPYLPRTNNATTATRLLTKATVDKAKTDTETYYPFRKGSQGVTFVETDLELIEELGLDLYRFSISWSRLFPTGEEQTPSPAGVAYYDKVFKFLKEKGIKVFLTMNHYAVPLHLVEAYGGWTNRKTIDHYLHFAEFVLTRWGDAVDYWLPFNEINAGYFSPYNGVGLLKPESGDYDLSDVFKSLHHQFVASAKTIQLGRKLGVKGVFGAMISCFCYYPLTPKPEDNLQLVKDEQINQWFCLDVLSRGYYPYYMRKFFADKQVSFTITAEDEQLLQDYTCDFVSFSYYSSSISSVDESKHQTAGNLVSTTKNPYLEASEWGWQIDPQGLFTTLLKVADRYEKPIIISENGLGAHDVLENGQIHDPYRIAYFQQHFAEIEKAIVMGVDVRAYIAWGIIDIVSAGSCEMQKRYGVVYVDAENDGSGSYQRYKKDSFDWYQNFIDDYHQKHI